MSFAHALHEAVTSMRTIADPYGNPLYQATCSCGWEGQQWNRQHAGRVADESDSHYQSAIRSERASCKHQSMHRGWTCPDCKAEPWDI